MSVAEVLAMDPGEQVPSIQGTVKVIFDRKTGTNDKGEWAIQGFVLKDGESESEIIVSLKNREPLDKGLRGKPIWIVSHQKAKGGISGIKREEYQGKAQLSVTESAELVRSDGKEKSESPEPTEVPTAGKPQDKPANVTQLKQPAPEPKGATDKPKSHGDKLAVILNLQMFFRRKVLALRLAADETMTLVGNFCEAHGIAFDEGVKKDIALLTARHMTDTTYTTMLISADKAGLVDVLPVVSAANLEKIIAAAKTFALKGNEEERKRADEAKQKLREELKRKLQELGGDVPAEADAGRMEHDDKGDN